MRAEDLEFERRGLTGDSNTVESGGARAGILGFVKGRGSHLRNLGVRNLGSVVWFTVGLLLTMPLPMTGLHGEGGLIWI